MRIHESNSLADTKAGEKGEGGGAPAVGSEIPLQPVEVHRGAEIYLQALESPFQSKGVSKGGCDPMGSP